MLTVNEASTALFKTTNYTKEPSCYSHIKQALMANSYFNRVGVVHKEDIYNDKRDDHS